MVAQFRNLGALSVSARTAETSRIPIGFGSPQPNVSGGRYLPARSVTDGLQSSFAYLDKLEALQPNWDSYGAVSITPTALKAACQFLVFIWNTFPGLSGEKSGIQAHRILPSAIVPVSDGGIQLEWNGLVMDIELEIDSDEKLSYLLIDKQNTEKRFKEESYISLAKAVGLVYTVLKN